MADLARLKSMVERAADLTADAREASEKDRDYYDGYQWTAEEKAILGKRKQPVLTINRIRRKIDAMIGIEQRGRVDPRAWPRNPQDEAAADVATKALVFVEEKERIDVKRSRAFENLLVEGYGGVEVIAEERGGQMEVCVKQLRWEELFFDPHSREKDFSDAAYLGVQKWMTLEAATEYAMQFVADTDPADVMEMLDVSGGASETGETYDDRPLREGQMAWHDRRQKRVRVAQMYYRQGGAWRLAVFSGKAVLHDEFSPYYDETGKPCCPIILMSAYVDRENRRYGLVRDLIPLQDEVNKRRSKLLHALNHRQTMGYKGAVDVAAMKRQLAMPDGHVEINPIAAEDGVRPFEMIPLTDQIAGQFSLLTEAKAEIDMLGPNASLLGQLEGNQSGRAIMAQQQAGLAELAPIYDSLRDWTERVYRAVWMRIRQFWTAPRWIRVTDDNEAPRFMGLNQVAMGPMGPQMVNAVAEIDVDIQIDQAPEYASLRSEQFQKLAELAQAGLPIPPRAILEASDLRDKAKLMEMIDGPPEAQQMQAQQQQEQAEVARRAAEAEIASKEARAIRDRAAAEKDLMDVVAAQEARAMAVRQSEAVVRYLNAG
jgi:hypothetical protein